MPEKLDLTTPLTDAVRAGLTASTAELVPYGIHFALGIDPVTRAYQDAGSYVHVLCMGQQGIRHVVEIATGATARTLITALNKARLDSKSLLKRVLEQLQSLDAAKYAGVISGSPD
jgi:hypothetical protein